METKVVYKFGTGQPVPMIAKYLCTREETTAKISHIPHPSAPGSWDQYEEKRNTLVWHYYELPSDVAASLVHSGQMKGTKA